MTDKNNAYKLFLEDLKNEEFHNFLNLPESFKFLILISRINRLQKEVKELKDLRT